MRKYITIGLSAACLSAMADTTVYCPQTVKCVYGFCGSSSPYFYSSQIYLPRNNGEYVFSSAHMLETRIKDVAHCYYTDSIYSRTIDFISSAQLAPSAWVDEGDCWGGDATKCPFTVNPPMNRIHT